MQSCPAEKKIKIGELIGRVRCNCVFVCDALSHKRRLDLRRDNLGVWKEGHRSPRMPYKDAQSVHESNANTYVWRMNFSCKSHKQLKKTEVHRVKRLQDGSVGDIISPAIIIYQYERESLQILRYCHMGMPRIPDLSTRLHGLFMESFAKQYLWESPFLQLFIIQ